MLKRTLNWAAAVSVCIGVLWSASPVEAKDIFVAQAATGNADGTDAADAYALAWLNTAANWNQGAGTIQSGDTVHLVGTLATNLTISGNGTAGNPITILFEPGAKFSAPTWTGKIISGNLNYVIIDGGANGVIEATANGFGLANANNFNAIDVTSKWGVEIKNLTINNLFVRVSNSVDCSTAPSAIRVGGAGMRDLSIHNCSITNTGNGIVVYPQAGISTNIQVYSNTVFNCSWGIYCEPASQGAQIYNTKIWANRINNGFGWDGCPGPFHQDGIITGSPYLNSTNYNTEIYRNWIGPDCGYSSTSAIYLESTQSSECNQYPRIYNNFVVMNSGQRWNSGTIAACASGTKIYNNTIVGVSYPAGLTFQITAEIGADIENNFVLNANAMYHEPVDAPAGYTPHCIATADYNVGAGVYLWWATGSFTWGGSTSYRDHVSYPQFLNFDNHSSNRTPQLNAGYQPLSSDTLLIGKGTNLSAYFTTDFNGNPRPSVDPWTIGAFEVSSSLTSISPPTVHSPVKFTP
jgi:hypothetical protein